MNFQKKTSCDEILYHSCGTLLTLHTSSHLYTSWLKKRKMAENIHITNFMYGLRHALVSLVLPREPTSAPN